MYCLESIKFDVSNTSYYVEVENGALLCDVTLSWKTILGGRGKHGNVLGKNCGNRGTDVSMYIPAAWNSLPASIKLTTDTNRLKKLLKAHLFHIAF